MRHTLIASVVVAVLVLSQAPAWAGACVADKFGGLICGEGNDALRVFPETISPSKKFAFAWRTAKGLGNNQYGEPSADVEDDLIRIADGAILAKLGGDYWDNGKLHPNRDQLVAFWSADSRAVVEVKNSRWESDAFRYYAIEGDKATTLDLRALVEPALRAKLPASQRERYVFLVRNDLPMTLDARGHLRFVAMLFEPKNDPILNCRIVVDIKAGGRRSRIVSIQRIDPRL